MARVIPISKARQAVIDECHIWGHWWAPVTVDDDHPLWLVQHFKCERGCNSLRRQKIGREDTESAGDSLGNNYTYADDYKFRHGDHISAAENRKTMRLARTQRPRRKAASRRKVAGR